MYTLNEVVENINEMIKDQKLGTLTIHDEHMLLRTCANIFREKLGSTPQFYFDVNADGGLKIRLGEWRVDA